jgi:hypothetical protein
MCSAGLSEVVGFVGLSPANSAEKQAFEAVLVGVAAKLVEKPFVWKLELVQRQ